MDELKSTYKFGLYIDYTLKAIKQDIIRRFKDNGISLTPEQWTILNVVNEAGVISQKELAGSTFKDAPTVSRIIDLLTERGLLQRSSDPSDRRKILIKLTKDGIDILQRSSPIIFAARSEGWKGLDDSDYSELKRILDRIYANIQSV